MIAPQELRLGNFVKTLEGIFEIRAVNQHHVALSTGIITTYPAIEPIELTEDWLLKFGFEKKAEHNFGLKVFARSIIHAYTHGKVEIELGNMSGYSFGYPQVYFVHQLQNLHHSLCGNELKIKEI